MRIEDDRTDEQRQTHKLGVCMTDSFLSGWGLAKDGVSYAVWACLPSDVDAVERWVRRRGEAKRVRVVNLRTYRPRGRGHCHIYVAGERHGAQALPQEAQA